MEFRKVDVGMRIQDIRINKVKMSKGEFAKILGITSQHLGSIEHGTAGISLEKLIKICEITDVSADYLLFGKDDNLISKEIKEALVEYKDEEIDNIILMVKSILNHIKYKNANIKSS